MPARFSLIAVLLTLLLAAPVAAYGKKGPAPSAGGRERVSPGQVLAPPVNDRCEAALLLSCGNIMLSGNTDQATNDYTFADPINSCTGYAADGKDVVYKMNVGPGDSLWVNYRTVTDGSVYLVTDCSNIDGSCVAGADHVALPGETEQLRYKFVTGGEYYLILDSYAPGTSGDWTAVGQLVCGPSTPPSNDLCETAIPIPCGAFSVSGSTEFAHNYYSLGPYSCNGFAAAGHDVVYKVTAVPGDSIWLFYTSSTNASIYLVTDCGNPDPSCVWGEDQNPPGVAEWFRYGFEFAGTYYLILDSRDPDSWGTWTAVGEFICVNPPPPNDRCENAEPIPYGDIDLSGSTQLATNDYFFTGITTCTGYSADGRDVTYQLDALAGDSLLVDYLTLGTDGAVYVVTDCSSAEASCVAGEDQGVTDEVEQLRYEFPAAGTYYLILDSVDPDTWGNWTAVGRFVHGSTGVEPLRVPGILELRTIAPNPFGRLTSIAYALPARARAALQIYDLQGRVARTLFNGEAAAGEHRVTWDGRDDQGARVGPGVYFARLSSGGSSAIKRMIFVN
jgi:hypothetical protein